MPAASTSRRTTAPKPNVVDFDAERKKAKKGKKGDPIKPLHAFGRDWDLKKPNIALVGKLLDTDDIASMTAYVAAHVVKDQREDLIAAMLTDEDLDIDDMVLISGQVTEAVYEGLPT